MEVLRTHDEFFKSLSEAEWDEGEAIADLAHALCRNITEDAELLFVRVALERKRANPDARSGELLNAGLVAIGKPPITFKQCVVSPDVAKARHSKKTRVRGV